jgi:hypothetical protein
MSCPITDTSKPIALFASWLGKIQGKLLSWIQYWYPHELYWNCSLKLDAVLVPHGNCTEIAASSWTQYWYLMTVVLKTAASIWTQYWYLITVVLKLQPQVAPSTGTLRQLCWQLKAQVGPSTGILRQLYWQLQAQVGPSTGTLRQLYWQLQPNCWKISTPLCTVLESLYSNYENAKFETQRYGGHMASRNIISQNTRC